MSSLEIFRKLTSPERVLEEIRSWLATAGALRHVPGAVLAYEEMPEWLTGMAVATFTPEER